MMSYEQYIKLEAQRDRLQDAVKDCEERRDVILHELEEKGVPKDQWDDVPEVCFYNEKIHGLLIELENLQVA